MQIKEGVLKVKDLFHECGLITKETLAQTCKVYFESLGIKFGLRHHNVRDDQFEILGYKAFLDVSHQTNMIPVSEADLKAVIEKAF